MLVKTTITKLFPSTKESFKSTPMYFTDKGIKSGKEKTNTRWKVTFECENGQTYYINLYDGRKVNQFYEGKEIWGDQTYGTFNNLEHYWITKEQFQDKVKIAILRREEDIESWKKELIRLKTLLS